MERLVNEKGSFTWRHLRTSAPAIACAAQLKQPFSVNNNLHKFRKDKFPRINDLLLLIPCNRKNL